MSSFYLLSIISTIQELLFRHTVLSGNSISLLAEIFSYQDIQFFFTTYNQAMLILSRNTNLIPYDYVSFQDQSLQTRNVFFFSIFGELFFYSIYLTNGLINFQLFSKKIDHETPLLFFLFILFFIFHIVISKVVSLLFFVVLKDMNLVQHYNSLISMMRIVRIMSTTTMNIFSFRSISELSKRDMENIYDFLNLKEFYSLANDLEEQLGIDGIKILNKNDLNEKHLKVFQLSSGSNRSNKYKINSLIFDYTVSTLLKSKIFDDSEKQLVDMLLDKDIIENEEVKNCIHEDRKQFISCFSTYSSFYKKIKKDCSSNENEKSKIYVNFVDFMNKNSMIRNIINNSGLGQISKEKSLVFYKITHDLYTKFVEELSKKDNVFNKLELHEDKVRIVNKLLYGINDDLKVENNNKKKDILYKLFTSAFGNISEAKKKYLFHLFLTPSIISLTSSNTDSNQKDLIYYSAVLDSIIQNFLFNLREPKNINNYLSNLESSEDKKSILTSPLLISGSTNLNYIQLVRKLSENVRRNINYYRDIYSGDNYSALEYRNYIAKNALHTFNFNNNSALEDPNLLYLNICWIKLKVSYLEYELNRDIFNLDNLMELNLFLNPDDDERSKLALPDMKGIIEEINTFLDHDNLYDSNTLVLLYPYLMENKKFAERIHEILLSFEEKEISYFYNRCFQEIDVHDKKCLEEGLDTFFNNENSNRNFRTNLYHSRDITLGTKRFYMVLRDISKDEKLLQIVKEIPKSLLREKKINIFTSFIQGNFLPNLTQLSTFCNDLSLYDFYSQYQGFFSNIEIENRINNLIRLNKKNDFLHNKLLLPKYKSYDIYIYNYQDFNFKYMRYFASCINEYDNIISPSEYNKLHICYHINRLEGGSYHENFKTLLFRNTALFFNLLISTRHMTNEFLKERNMKLITDNFYDIFFNIKTNKELSDDLMRLCSSQLLTNQISMKDIDLSPAAILKDQKDISFQQYMFLKFAHCLDCTKEEYYKSVKLVEPITNEFNKSSSLEKLLDTVIRTLGPRVDLEKSLKNLDMQDIFFLSHPNLTLYKSLLDDNKKFHLNWISIFTPNLDFFRISIVVFIIIFLSYFMEFIFSSIPFLNFREAINNLDMYLEKSENKNIFNINGSKIFSVIYTCVFQYSLSISSDDYKFVTFGASKKENLNYFKTNCISELDAIFRSSSHISYEENFFSLPEIAENIYRNGENFRNIYPSDISNLLVYTSAVFKDDANIFGSKKYKLLVNKTKITPSQRTKNLLSSSTGKFFVDMTFMGAWNIISTYLFTSNSNVIDKIYLTADKKSILNYKTIKIKRYFIGKVFDFILESSILITFAMFNIEILSGDIFYFCSMIAFNFLTQKVYLDILFLNLFN